MKKFSRITRSVKKNFDKHSPEILFGIGIAGMITATVAAVRATPKALAIIDYESELRMQKQEIADDSCKKVIVRLKAIEIVKLTWLYYVPAMAIGMFSMACLISSNSVNSKRNAALATACKLSETAFSEYQEKVIETIGEKKEGSVRDKIAKEHIDRAPVSKSEVVITDNGESVCHELISGRYFKSDIDRIRKVENILNKQLLDDSYISLNDFYYELGLKATSLGDILGWHIDDGLIELYFSTQLSDDEKPCLVINFRNAPRYDYQRML